MLAGRLIQLPHVVHFAERREPERELWPDDRAANGETEREAAMSSAIRAFTTLVATQYSIIRSYCHSCETGRPLRDTSRWCLCSSPVSAGLLLCSPDPDFTT